MSTLQQQLEALIQIHTNEQLSTMIQLLDDDGITPPSVNTGEYQAFCAIVSRIFSDSTISSSKKVEFGEKLNKWGDPRLVSPSADEYWASVDLEHYELQVGRNLVTIKEWKAFLESGYSDESNWTESGLAWKAEKRPTWTELASSEESRKFLFDNQPVVGVCWYEAQAYATANKARLMSFSERLLIYRGTEKRPYPWGEWIQGRSNTQEEGLEKPCAVGLYNLDCTPEGIYDLAGNVAEWTEDEDETKRVIHPGSWNIGSMGAWCKASALYSAAARTG